MLPSPAVWPFLLLHLGVCAAVAVVLVRRLARRAVLGRAIAAVAIVTCVGLALGFTTAPRPGSYAFAVLLAWSWTLGLVLPSMLAITGVVLLRRSRRSGWVFVIGSSLVVAAAIEAFAIEPTQLEVNHHVVHSDRIDTPLRIAVIADLQTDSPGEHERAALRAVMAAEPDVIVFPGDLIQTSDLDRYRAQWSVLREMIDEVGLAAPLGIWVVQGDVELPDVWLRELPTEFIVLDGSVRLRDDVDLSGLDLRRSARAEALSRPSDDRLHVVMGHRPDFALGSVDADLLLAGHTHGGQVQLPFFGPLVTLSRVPRAWAAGRTETDDDTTLIVSRGVGMERGLAPRLRFLCRPEILLIDVQP